MCPYCHEPVAPGTDRCPHCGEWIDKVARGVPPLYFGPEVRRALVALAVIVLAVITLLFALS